MRLAWHRRLQLGVVAVVVSCVGALAGCGTGADTGGASAMSGTSAEGGASAGSSVAATGGDEGTITLTVDGATTSFEAGDCYLLNTSSIALTLNTHGLHASLPPDPGTFADEDYGSVILPPPGDGDEYRPTGDVHGRWSLSGERASGHVEGVAHLLSGLASGDDKDFPFSFDFECPYSDISGG